MASGNGYHATAPDRTTPQWSLGPDVERGHEGADANLLSITTWLGIVAVTVVVAIGVLYGVYVEWANTRARPQAVASPLVAVQPVPPEPRILPNPVDSGHNPRTSSPNYPEALPAWRQQEEQELKRVGLLDPQTGQPALPARAAAAVLKQAGSAGGAGPAEMMPASASGGTMPENRLAGER